MHATFTILVCFAVRLSCLTAMKTWRGQKMFRLFFLGFRNILEILTGAAASAA